MRKVPFASVPFMLKRDTFWKQIHYSARKRNGKKNGTDQPQGGKAAAAKSAKANKVRFKKKAPKSETSDTSDTDEDGDKIVWYITQSLYGMKQSGRNWYERIRQWLINYGFEPSHADPCVFQKQTSKGKFELPLLSNRSSSKPNLVRNATSIN